MRFALPLLLSCTLASTARADATADVDKLVRTHLDASIGRQGALVATLAVGAAIVGADGRRVALATECAASPKAAACSRSVPLFGAAWSGKLAYTNLKPAIRVDDKRGFATFFVTADVAGELAGPVSKVKGKAQVRVDGVAKRGSTGWKVIGAKYTAALPDTVLAKHGDTFAGAGATAPRSPLEKEVTSWFGHLADHQSANAIGVGGTAPEELATDPAAITKLVKAIDTLTLKPYSSGVVEAGEVAFVYTDVTLVATKQAVDLNAGIVVVKDGATWKWVAINFSAIELAQHALQ
jgi:hypothetical protein